MQDLVSVLSQNIRSVTYSVAKVSAVQASLGTVSINWNGNTVTGVPYLTSYSPVVGDKVQILVSESVGSLVLGKTIAGVPPATPVSRTAFVNPTRSMTWTEDATTGLNGAATEGIVTQGSNVLQIFSGAYVYPKNVVTLATGELIIKAELLLSRVDVTSKLTASPVLHELTSFSTEGKPTIAFPQREYSPADMLAGDVAWTPVPVVWATNIIKSSSTIGLAFSPSGAQSALTFSQYASYQTISDGATARVGGSLRLTIQ